MCVGVEIHHLWNVGVPYSQENNQSSNFCHTNASHGPNNKSYVILTYNFLQCTMSTRGIAIETENIFACTFLSPLGFKTIPVHDILN